MDLNPQLQVLFGLYTSVAVQLKEPADRQGNISRFKTRYAQPIRSSLFPQGQGR